MKEEKFPHTRKPLHWWRWGGEGGKGFRATKESALQRAKRRDSRTRGLSAHPPGRAGLGAEARASVGSQGEDWGWRREHSLKGLVRHG